ncbi:acyl-CoA thioesterase [Bradyrhizobium prioriisuperbiae]|uniref:acyl-CoA thioesterase n=1 Tax=Bradyrhizobium prioriisuperbiae TaxID=2854389 RepID=UPI0028E6A836|nr:acyl-CoA thioesterase [Bradyrhizobium prioritasuperba]
MRTAIPSEADPAETRFVEMVFPEHANHYGTLFGGMALSLMGKAAFVAASRHARCPVVMARSDRIAFDEPVRVGELIELVARVVRSGSSAMTVAVDMIREDLLSGQRTAAVRGTFEMVAVNASGRPVRIPKSKTETKTISRADKETVS